ncbi:hypothetical protein E2P86_13690 [Sphingobacterium psychroaquaticum]|uniref:hypothetical protein n=1 Tax=Sphingobacterium psychroaquaticum TaxID=561061 RepID=UPI00106C1157|nr:hypothetical protein [Sphingobacterium psychroaquaticum]QBQ42145.1 hypothetical protein E2P86_13690 [Sphingobacterium psychroaquaticum]
MLSRCRLHLNRCSRQATSFFFFLLLQTFVCASTVSAQTVPRETLGKVKDSALGELSGLIQSNKYPNKFWTHNDSGDSARIFLIDNKAALETTYWLSGIKAVDIEDIAKFKWEGRSYLVVADIGDNLAVRNEVQLYIFEEPDWHAGLKDVHIPKEKIRTLRMRYPDKPRDAEALFVDPQSLTCYLISKRDFKVGLYAVNIMQSPSESILLEPKTNLPFTFITSADISDDGRWILVKNLTEVFLWERNLGVSVVLTLQQKPIKLPYQPEPQGEAICFDQDSSVFYTISERPLGLDSYLYRYSINSID